MRSALLFSAVLIGFLMALTDVYADPAAEMAKKLQNPLANIKALMTDNAIGFNTGDDKGTSYGFQLQPVYAIDMPDRGFTFIPRAVIPIMGLEPGTDNRFTGEDGKPTPSKGSEIWGLGDSLLQFFFAPHSNKGWKWGIGPQLSLPTRTKSEFRGPDWGAGVAGILVGNLTDNISFAGIAGNHWSFGGKFNAGMLQPQLYYNFDSVPGAYVAYNAVISVDWKADSDNRWTVPVGFGCGSFRTTRTNGETAS